jgi:hypothetical protein
MLSVSKGIRVRMRVVIDPKFGSASASVMGKSGQSDGDGGVVPGDRDYFRAN